MDDRIARHAEALDTLDRIVEQVSEEQLGRDTPCAGWTVADLLAHEIGQHRGFARAVIAGDAPRSAYAPVPFSTKAWRDSVEAVLQAFAGADPDLPVVERELNATPLTLRVVVDAQLLDVVAHTWDLAKGLGHDYAPPDHVAEDFLRMSAAIRDAAYGEGRPFSERLGGDGGGDGSDWERALRLLGRDPAWPGSPVG